MYNKVLKTNTESQQENCSYRITTGES